MPIVTRSELRELLAHRQSYSVTIHMPTHRAGCEVQQDPVRLKNALGEAREQLHRAGLAERHARRQLAEAHNLLHDGTFWRRQGNGLAVDISPDQTRVYRLPVERPTLVHVGERFLVRPMLRVIGEDRRVCILPLSGNESRVFQATRFGVRPIELVDAPQSMAELTRYVDEEKSRQFHASATPGLAGGKRALSFHGHGVGVDEGDEHKRLAEYCRLADGSIENELADGSEPLVLATEERLQPAYREVSHDSNLLDEGVPGNPEQLNAQDLHAEAWPFVESIFEGRCASTCPASATPSAPTWRSMIWNRRWSRRTMRASGRCSRRSTRIAGARSIRRRAASSCTTGRP
jgi:hypothetical protein